MSRNFSNTDCWIFDLDNTLYPHHCNLFAQIDVRMGDYLSDLLQVDKIEARRVQKDYFHRYGTTLRGLMHHHDVNPRDYLDYVHDIDVSVVPANPDLARAIENLPGRKIIFTNGDLGHAQRVMARIGITHLMHGVFDVVAADFVPKPDPVPYAKMVAEHDVAPERAAMFEDLARNLVPAAQMGMTTVWAPHDDSDVPDDHVRAHIHHETEDLTTFLTALAADG